MNREEEIIRRLNDQDLMLDKNKDTMDQILWLIKGSEQLGIEGVIPELKRTRAALKELTDWKAEIMASKGMLNIQEAGKWIAFASLVMGVLSAVGSAMYFAVQKAIEFFSKN